MPARSSISLLGLAVVLTAAAGCASEQLGSELEAEAVFACGSAIEKRLDTSLPPGWQFLKQEQDRRTVMRAWAPERDPEDEPDYICSVVPDEEAPGGIRVVRVHEGTR